VRDIPTPETGQLTEEKAGNAIIISMFTHYKCSTVHTLLNRCHTQTIAAEYWAK